MLQQTVYKTPEELRISQELFDALIEVRDMLLDGRIRLGEFDMHIVQEEVGDCGTIACIGGWCGILMNQSIQETRNMVCELYAKESIAFLFFPDFPKGYNAKPHQAAQAIQNFLMTRDPQWEKVMEC